MKFLSKVELPKSAWPLDHSKSIVCLGSCFANEIGTKLGERLFDSLSNPLGTLFNPLAIAELISRSLEGRQFEETEFFPNQELWRNFLTHSSLASPDKEKSIATANNALSQLGEKLRRCDLIILTLGSAWIYEAKEGNVIVGHNHKLPIDQFRKRLLTPKEIEDTLRRSISFIRSINPRVHLCITVSPVRHLRDGLIENNLSKSSLLLAANSLRSNLSDLDYFPAYEILLDELRDYRFYAEDLSHPSPQAIRYIWERFSQVYFSSQALQICEKIESIDTALSHNPLHTDTLQYQVFKDSIESKIFTLEDAGLYATRLREKWNRLP